MDENRVPLTGTAFDFIRIDIPCPECREDFKHPLREMTVSDSAVCPRCEFAVDLKAEGWPARILKLSEEYKQIKPTKGG